MYAPNPPEYPQANNQSRDFTLLRTGRLKQNTPDGSSAAMGRWKNRPFGGQAV